jgi:MFS-type transporter involved in bile tolerance (Atg22 family)
MKEPEEHLWKWWVKWWVWASFFMLIILIFSEPPRTWLWLILFVILVVFGLNKSLRG